MQVRETRLVKRKYTGMSRFAQIDFIVSTPAGGGAVETISANVCPGTGRQDGVTEP